MSTRHGVTVVAFPAEDAPPRFVARCEACGRLSARVATVAEAAVWSAEHRGLDVSTAVDRVCAEARAEFMVRQAFAAITGVAA